MLRRRHGLELFGSGTGEIKALRLREFTPAITQPRHRLTDQVCRLVWHTGGMNRGGGGEGGSDLDTNWTAARSAAVSPLIEVDDMRTDVEKARITTTIHIVKRFTDLLPLSDEYGKRK